MFLSIIAGTLTASQPRLFSPAELQFLGEEEPTAVDGRHICVEPEPAQEHRRDGCSGSQVRTGTRLPQVGEKNPRARALADCHQHGGRVAAVDVNQHLDVDGVTKASAPASFTRTFECVYLLQVGWVPKLGESCCGQQASSGSS